MIRYNLGRSENRPPVGAFSFAEKFEYWALAWGVILMGVTGTMLWFDNFFVRFLPKGVLDVVLVIHYYEAWLATLAIAIWHLYATIFNPRIYPMNPSWLTGKMPVRQYRHEHGAENVEVPMYE
jgi:cytochrome b subunit of formate dehydrogenase